MQINAILTAISLCALPANLFAQSVGIGTTTPSNAAQLDVSSTSKGLLIPRMTQAQRDLLAPVEGLMLYNTNSNSFQYFSGGNWINVAHSGIINGAANKVARFSGTWSLVPGLLTDNGSGVAINSNNANPANSALLDITSNNKGILVPRMTTTERNAIASPAKGLLLFDNTTNSFWFHNGSIWTELAAGGGTNNWALNGTNISNINSGNVGIGTTTPLARLHVIDSAVLFTGKVGSIELLPPYPTLPIQGTGIRMMWHPGKAAFRAGGTFGNNWNIDSIGNFSTAFGLSTMAKGVYSTSMGARTTATGSNSTSMGEDTEAIGITSTSMGRGTQAVGVYTTSMGAFTIAKANGSISMGSYNDENDNPNSNPSATDRIFQLGNGSSNTARRNAVTVLRNGNVGIGELRPDFVLDVNGRMRIQSNNSLSAGINLNNNANSAMAAFMGMRSTDNEVGYYGYTGTAGWRFLVNTTTGNAWMQGTLTQNSDIRLKKNITPLSHALNSIRHINGYSYHWKDPSNPDLQIGFIAQELQKVYPELVKENEQGNLSVNYSGMIPVLLEAIKELQQKVEELEKKIK